MIGPMSGLSERKGIIPNGVLFREARDPGKPLSGSASGVEVGSERPGRFLIAAQDPPPGGTAVGLLAAASMLEPRTRRSSVMRTPVALPPHANREGSAARIPILKSGWLPIGLQ